MFPQSFPEFKQDFIRLKSQSQVLNPVWIEQSVSGRLTVTGVPMAQVAFDSIGGGHIMQFFRAWEGMYFTRRGFERKHGHGEVQGRSHRPRLSDLRT